MMCADESFAESESEATSTEESTSEESESEESDEPIRIQNKKQKVVTLFLN